MREFLGEQLEIGVRLLKTVGLLFGKPGALPREWREGHRARYVGPVKLYLMASVVFFGVASVLGLPVHGIDLSRTQPLSAEIDTSAYALATEAMATRMQGFLTLITAGAVPLLALWLRFRYRRTRLHYVDHVVFSLYLHALVLFGLTVAYVSLFRPAVRSSVAAAAATVTAGLGHRSFLVSYPAEGGRLGTARPRWPTTGGSFPSSTGA